MLLNRGKRSKALCCRNSESERRRREVEHVPARDVEALSRRGGGKRAEQRGDSVSPDGLPRQNLNGGTREGKRGNRLLPLPEIALERLRNLCALRSEKASPFLTLRGKVRRRDLCEGGCPGPKKD